MKHQMRHQRIRKKFGLALTAFALSTLLAGATPFVNRAVAQNETPDAILPAGVLPGGAAPTALRILEVGPENIAALRGLSGSGGAAVSLGISLAQLRADSASALALAGWVRDGGVVFLHTDAAQFFGYKTVKAREGTNALGGQLYGRAVNALPFGAHPLLWSDTVAAGLGEALPEINATSRTFPQLGVSLVYYQMQPGDDLVLEHPAAVPLLRVTDLSQPTEQPEYAAAIAPYGNGWTVFVPRFIEQNRADGKAFAQNLMRFVSATGSPAALGMAPLGAAPAAAVPSSVEPLLGISGPAIEAAATALRAGGDFAALGAAWFKATAPLPPAAFSTPEQLAAFDNTPRVWATTREAAAVNGAMKLAAPSDSLRTEMYLLAARFELPRGQNQAANDWLADAADLSPSAAEVLLWQGIAAAAAGQDIDLDSRSRAQLFSQAATYWQEAAGASKLVPTPNVEGAAGVQSATVGGVQVTALTQWSSNAARTAQLMSVEPPLISSFNVPVKNMVLRHFPDDPTLRTALPTGALLARAAGFLGWDVQNEEVLIFPNDQYYQAYSREARVNARQMAFNPLAQRGNVVGNRILMVSQSTVPVLLSPGPPPIFAQLGAAVPSIIARLHAQVAINALTQDGTPPPGWMQLGLMSLSNIAVLQNLTVDEDMSQDLARSAAAGGLLTPQQFENANVGTDRSGVVEAQARRLMLYFYSNYGKGAVVETLQRLGAGQSPDEALAATTQMDQQQFFQAWYNSDFGRRR